MTYSPILNYKLQMLDEAGEPIKWLDPISYLHPVYGTDFDLDHEFPDELVKHMMRGSNEQPGSTPTTIRICNATVADINEDRATVALIGVSTEALEIIDCKEELTNGHDMERHMIATTRQDAISADVAERIYDAIQKYEGGKS